MLFPKLTLYVRLVSLLSLLVKWIKGPTQGEIKRKALESNIFMGFENRLRLWSFLIWSEYLVPFEGREGNCIVVVSIGFDSQLHYNKNEIKKSTFTVHWICLYKINTDMYVHRYNFNLKYLITAFGKTDVIHYEKIIEINNWIKI